VGRLGYKEFWEIGWEYKEIRDKINNLIGRDSKI